VKTLVLGGTGTVGSVLVERLLRSKVDVTVVTRDSNKAAAIPKRASAVVGDLENPLSLRDAFQDVESVFMISPISLTENYQGLAGVMLARQAGVGRFVYMSTHKADLTPWMPFGGGTKLAIENAVKASGMDYTILRPNYFFQNDLWLRESIMQGVYPGPVGFKGIQRVDARDIAEVAHVVLTTEGHDGKTYNIVGPKVETGPSSAEAWSKALGTPVVYPQDAVEQFSVTHAFMGPALVFVYRDFFRFYAENGMVGEPGDADQMKKLLGRAPCSLEQFAREIAPAWKHEAA
jgi:uncharacterized protein YbjT (DUF2867 family)